MRFAQINPDGLVIPPILMIDNVEPWRLWDAAEKGCTLIGLTDEQNPAGGDRLVVARDGSGHSFAPDPTWLAGRLANLREVEEDARVVLVHAKADLARARRALASLPAKPDPDELESSKLAAADAEKATGDAAQIYESRQKQTAEIAARIAALNGGKI
jgi:hypothetical protein